MGRSPVRNPRQSAGGRGQGWTWNAGGVCRLMRRGWRRRASSVSVSSVAKILHADQQGFPMHSAPRRNEADMLRRIELEVRKDRNQNPTTSGNVKRRKTESDRRLLMKDLIYCLAKAWKTDDGIHKKSGCGRQSRLHAQRRRPRHTGGMPQILARKAASRLAGGHPAGF